MNVYVRQMEGAFASSVPTEIDVRIATIEEARAWYASAGAGGAWAEPDGISFMLVRCVQKPGARLFIAWREGQMLGAGGFELHDGVAALMAASTLPVFRNQGVQTALLRARLAAAQAAGADLVVVHTEPGTASQRNVLRAGFELIYTIVNVVGPR